MSPSAKGIFIAGTDTDAGKTLVSAAVAAWLVSAGIKTAYIKPFASGCHLVEGHMVSDDALLVKSLSGLEQPAHEMTPVCLTEPLSPVAAARAAGFSIDSAAVLGDLRARLAGDAFHVVEGVGGLLVPINRETTLADFMAELGLPVLLVGRAGLGTINHTLLSLEALATRGLTVVGFCFSGPPPQEADDPSLPDNHQEIARFSGTPFLGRLPWLGEAEKITREQIIQAAREHLDLEMLLH